MDPLYEQRLRDEVIFLHSLWYQGPPRPAAAAAAATRYHLQPSKSVHFKKDPKGRGKSRKIFPNYATPDPTLSHEAEWPHPATPPPATAWPAACGPTPEPLPLSAEEQSKLSGKHAHQHALKVVHEFFISNNAEGFDEIDSGDDDDGDQLMDEDCGDEEISFFFKVFEDSKLREYYEKNFIIGEFGCLVCRAVGGKKTGKKFKGCLPLVQHSITIGKTKKRRAHRAFAQAVCKVLGWEIHRLPEIVSMLSDKFGNTQGNGNDDKKESSVAFVQNVDSVKDDTIDGKDDGAAPASDAGKHLEDTGIVHMLRDVEEPASDGLTMNFLACPDADNNTGNEVRPSAIAAIASTSASVPIIRYHLQPSKATQFKKKKKKKSKCKSGKKLTNNAATESNSSHGTEWPCPSPPHPPSTSGWPTTGWATLEKSSLKPLPLSTEEQLILAGRHAHQHALKVVHEFFRTNNSDDSDEIDSGSDDDDDDDDDDELMEEDSGSEEYSFFFKVFEEDTKLREYYVKNFAEGEFSCLICGAMGGKKTGKKFKGCSPLLQHLITIAKTKKRKAHRAFGRAVCKVLGWDINRLPAIESMLSDKTGDTQISLTCVDANKNLENPGMVHQQSMEEPASQELTSNSLACSDAGNNENLGMVHQVEQPTSEGSTIDLTYPDADKNLGNGNLHSHNLDDPTAGFLASICLTCADANKNLENPGMVHQQSMEEPASQELTINSLACPDAGNNENLGMVHQEEQPASESSTINLTCPDADRNLGNDNLHAHNLEDPTAECLASAPLNDEQSREE